jgi:hypothetical protein
MHKIIHFPSLNSEQELLLTDIKFKALSLHLFECFMSGIEFKNTLLRR